MSCANVQNVCCFEPLHRSMSLFFCLPSFLERKCKSPGQFGVFVQDALCLFCPWNKTGRHPTFLHQAFSFQLTLDISLHNHSEIVQLMSGYFRSAEMRRHVPGHFTPELKQPNSFAFHMGCLAISSHRTVDPHTAFEACENL